MLQDSYSGKEYRESILNDTTSTLLTEGSQLWLSSTDNPSVSPGKGRG